MPKQRNEETKKHGDKMEPLIERTGSDSAPGQRDERADEDPRESSDE